MSHIIIDRRKNDKGKSSVNRRKFVSRVRSTLKEAIKETIGDVNIKDLAQGKGKVKIPLRNLDQPWFHHDDSSGEHHIVRPGNERFRPGDKIKRPPKGSGKGRQGSPDGEDEDAFTFHLTREEFLDLLFDNCELPNLIKKSFAMIHEEELKRSGYISEGPPTQLNIVRSMRRAKARRFGLRASKKKELRELQNEEQQLKQEITDRRNQGLDISIEEQHLKQVQEKIEILQRKIKAVPFIDPMDLRYTNYTKVTLPAVQAVMFCIMDVSGSMGEREKQLAKTFFLLLYLFLMKNYKRVDIVYVRHHTTAKEVDEQEFYYSHESGGTVISSALELTCEIIQQRYPLSQWNIYMAQASDGDNYPEDNKNVKNILLQRILPIVQYFAYIQIDPDEEYHNFSISLMNNEANLWSTYEDIAKIKPNMGVARVSGESQIYTALTKLFEKKRVTS